MTFCDRIELTLKCRAGIYGSEGNLVDGHDIGFNNVEDILNTNGNTYIRCGNEIVVLDRLLSQDACNLIKVSYELSMEKGAADFMQPLDYILKNDIENENIKGKFTSYNTFYIKSNANIIDILNDIYEGCAYNTARDDEGIYFVKQMDDVEQEAEAIINEISQEKGIKVIIGSGRVVNGNYTIKDSAEHAKTACTLALNLGLKEGFYHIDKMIMYGFIYSMDKKKIDFYMNGGYSGFNDVVRDKELTDTAEELFRCHLNISEAARRLYLHRNTLLYRIEKIKNLTGLDIKKFEEAVIFRTVTSIYKLNG